MSHRFASFRRFAPVLCGLALGATAWSPFATAIAEAAGPRPAAPLKSAANPESEPAHVIPDTCAQPVYPPEAQAAGIKGSALLTISVAIDGRVENVSVKQTSGNAQLDAAAVEAMKQCRFSPATKNGAPVASQNALRYTFRIDESTPEQIAARNQLRAIIELRGIGKRIDAVTSRCAKLDGLVADNAKQAALQWHQRNDEIVKRTVQLQASVLKSFRQADDAKAADEKEAASRTAIEGLIDQGAATEAASIESAGDEREEQCQIFNSRTVGGEFDLRRLYPEFVSLIEAAPAPSAPAKKK
ncbi:energy transducer TonB [Hydrocarboniphaga effusa]|uniref:TonB C-terminal domain-containing protein n=1 Tax=Hydrocarboniphaga effusa AP103 TaxID=1172194 RepID=I7ZCW9_9GAMM|nr:energy transducer TonB [Hydrocarboniphaga effusa]EIT69497.1 hypothetical protein WQQ_30790 [Hydrocarboniphaga effusa AP103]